MREQVDGKDDWKYCPNKLTSGERSAYLFKSLALIIVGGFGLYNNDLWIPVKRGNLIHFHNDSAKILYGAFVFISLGLLSIIIDHYDERDNESGYRSFLKFTFICAATLVFASLVYGYALGDLTHHPRYGH